MKKKFLLVSLFLTIVLITSMALSACENTGNGNTNAFSSPEDVYGMGAVSSVKLLGSNLSANAVKSLADVLPDMIRLAEVEKSCQLMSAEIEKTRRRVNALEHVIIPEAQANIKYITMKLDENERSTQIRLMKVKDMMLEDTHHYKEKAEERAREALAEERKQN